MSAITGLDVIYGLGTEPKPDFCKIPVDLNKGTGGEYVYLCYSTTQGGSPINFIQVFAGSSEDFSIQNGYESVPYDLNKGAGGKYIYVCYTRHLCVKPVREVNVIQSPSREVYPPSSDWIRINQDCSAGAGGEYTYVVLRY